MEFSSSRKILVVIFSVIIAFSTAIALTSVTVNSTLASESFIIKNIVSGGVVSECEAQLKAKYAVLEAQSGIPSNVFETVTKEYPVADSVRQAFQNASGSESTDFYTDSLIKYFDTICTEYLDGNNLSYNKEYIHNTSVKAAEIFSQTVGIHNIRTLQDTTHSIKDFTLLMIIAAVLSAVVSALMITFMFSNKQRAYVCILSGASGGAAGAAFGAAACRIFTPFKDFAIFPEVYKASFLGITNKFFMLLALAGIAISVIIWLSMFFMNKKIRSKK